MEVRVTSEHKSMLRATARKWCKFPSRGTYLNFCKISNNFAARTYKQRNKCKIIETVKVLESFIDILNAIQYTSDSQMWTSFTSHCKVHGAASFFRSK